MISINGLSKEKLEKFNTEKKCLIELTKQKLQLIKDKKLQQTIFWGPDLLKSFFVKYINRETLFTNLKKHSDA